LGSTAGGPITDARNSRPSQTVDDVDLSASTLVVLNTKFFKTRLLPIGPKLSSALRLYAESRLTLLNRPPAARTFFLRRTG